MNYQRTLVKHIKPGDLVLLSNTKTKELLVVLCIKLLNENNYVANITFLNSKSRTVQSSGWVALHKVTV